VKEISSDSIVSFYYGLFYWKRRQKELEAIKEKCRNSSKVRKLKEKNSYIVIARTKITSV